MSFPCVYRKLRPDGFNFRSWYSLFFSLLAENLTAETGLLRLHALPRSPRLVVSEAASVDLACQGQRGRLGAPAVHQCRPESPSQRPLPANENGLALDRASRRAKARVG
jgi:hypothetical protein